METRFLGRRLDELNEEERVLWEVEWAVKSAPYSRFSVEDGLVQSIDEALWNYGRHLANALTEIRAKMD